MFLNLLFRDATLFAESQNEGGPFGAEDVRARKGAVTTADDECVDALLDEIVRSGEPTFERSESNRSRRSYEGTTLKDLGQ